jgi:hypothetical protein
MVMRLLAMVKGLNAASITRSRKLTGDLNTSQWNGRENEEHFKRFLVMRK